MITNQHLFEDEETLLSFLNSVRNTQSTKFLVQIYSSLEDDHINNIYRIIKACDLQSVIVGCSNCHIIFDGIVYHDGTMITLTALNNVECSIIYQNHNDYTEIQLNSHLYQQPHISTTAQLLSTLSYPQTKGLIDSLGDLLPDIHISGGILPRKTGLFYEGQNFDNGYIGLIFHSYTLHSHCFSTTALTPIGREHTITKAKNHIIYEIDKIPAKTFYNNYLGNDFIINKEYFGNKFPLMVKWKNTYLPSPIRICDDSDCISTKIPTKIGDIVSLGYGDTNYFLKELEAFNENLPYIPCQYLMVFSSNSQVKGALNNIDRHNYHLPVYGVLTDYEIVCKDQDIYLTTQNSVLHLMSSGENHTLNYDNNNFKVSKDILESEYSILLKLVENTSKELNELNKTLEYKVAEKTNELLNQYYVDHLTKLPNHYRLTDDINAGEYYALALIDISSFLNINNFYGSTIGNDVLTELASLITDFNNKHQFKTYRVHSDIFAVACKDFNFKLFCNRMRMLQTRIHKYCFSNHHQEIYITTTIAVSNIQLSLYENCGMTLQHAKSNKTPFLIYNESLDIEEAIISNLTWTSKIKNAINDSRIIPYFQPIYNNATDEIDRFEVLMRLIEKDGKVVSPNTFLPIAKKAGLYDRLTKMIIKKAFDYFHNKPYKFSVNISAEDIVNPRTRNYIYKKLMTFEHPEKVIFEIVESESIENYESMITFISEAKRLGASIAIDDFGTGFSNFHYLFKLNIDIIKIDGTIIQQMATEQSAELVAETIVSFANKMGIYTVAEYVSDENLYNKVKELGVDFSQGYFIARPGAEILI